MKAAVEEKREDGKSYLKTDEKQISRELNMHLNCCAAPMCLYISDESVFPIPEIKAAIQCSVVSISYSI